MVLMMNRTPSETLDDLVDSGLQFPPEELNVILRTVWPLLHGPLYRHDVATLLALFRRAGYVSDGLPYPDGDLIVYRGEPTSTEHLGISWTTDRQVAVTYVQGYSTIGAVRVVQAAAPVESVLARFNFEDEIVVEPELLKDVEVLGYMPQFKLSM
jgi:hypothetical protein